MQTSNPAALALICIQLLGLAIFAVNPRRPANRSLLLFTLTHTAWLVSIMLAFASHDAAQAEHWIKMCSCAGAFFPAVFNLLRLSIIHYKEQWRDHFRRNRAWFILALWMIALVLSPFAIRSVKMSDVGAGGVHRVIPEPMYGWGYQVYLASFLAAFAVLIVQLFLDQRNPRIVGIQRTELRFLLLGYLTVVAWIAFVVGFESITGTHQLVRYSPFRIVLFTIIIAYGITSQGILNVRAALRRGLAYLLFAVYAGLVFTASWYGFEWVFRNLGITVVAANASSLAQALCAGFAAVALVNSAGTPLRRVARRILPPVDIDFARTSAQVGSVVQSVTTLPELLARFSAILSAAISTPRVKVLLCENNRICEHDPEGTLRDPLCIPADDPIVRRLKTGVAEIATEELVRQAPTAERGALLARMEELAAEVVLPIRYHNELSGLLLLGSRSSGRFYGPDGRNVLRIITEQLGVAIANSRLYTEARQSQAYNQFLVEHLPCGVIATDPAGALTVINPEARRLLLLDEVAPPEDCELPKSVARLIPPALAGDQTAHDEEIILREGARDQTHLRVSCLPFASATDRMLGVLLVLNDHTTLDRLQRQVRQADRLASIGTLASGMAHEIKNPLTALKTFAQLLPRRYEDPEFRDSFSNIVGGEIGRIERIVNQLLAFARPAPLMIDQINVHDVIANATRLIKPQASRHGVEVRTAARARHEMVAADKDMLQQVLLNLLLNGLQAIEGNGWIELSTELEPGTLDEEAYVRVDVRDSGRGISQETLSHIFDPFFTTKSEGTGLGLSVSYNIIMEHRGRLEVQSKPGEGTCFSIYLPAC